MLLNCPQCQTQYRLDPALLGEQGRRVRCTSCGNIWHQLSAESDELTIPDFPAMDVDFQEPRKEDKEEKSFSSLLKEGASGIPEAVKPIPQGFQPAIMTHRPLGMSAGAFGSAVFLLLLFLTLGPLLLVKAPLVRLWPPMATFYGLIGVPVQAPGEGLRLSEMKAVQNISGEKKSFSIQASLTNVSERALHYPKLEATVENAGEIIRTWRFDAPQAEVNPGETLPVVLELEDLPKEAKTARLRVTGP